MVKFKQISILDMLQIFGEDICYSILSAFTCPFNKDVESFIQNSAINFAKQYIAITFLVFSESKLKLSLVGYYTLANKFVSVSCDSLSNSMKKRIAKFSQYNAESNCYLVSMPLIAQLGKNFSIPNVGSLITGAELLSLACERVKQAQKIIGGKMVYLECASDEKLYSFYTSNNFHQFGHRTKLNKELSESSMLIQMLRYL